MHACLRTCCAFLALPCPHVSACMPPPPLSDPPSSSLCCGSACCPARTPLRACLRPCCAPSPCPARTPMHVLPLRHPTPHAGLMAPHASVAGLMATPLLSRFDRVGLGRGTKDKGHSDPMPPPSLPPPKMPLRKASRPGGMVAQSSFHFIPPHLHFPFGGELRLTNGAIV